MTLNGRLSKCNHCSSFMMYNIYVKKNGVIRFSADVSQKWCATV
ncbi:unnamed protein product [Tenebrio molitor]|nr:unnamed protein product [Tenebrio molitor]